MGIYSQLSVPSSSSGNMVLIQSQTATNQTAVKFTTGITGFNVYYFLYYGVTISVNGDSLIIQYSTDGGASYSNAGYTIAGQFNNTTLNGVFGANTGVEFALSMDNSAVIPCDGFVNFFQFGNTTFQKHAIGRSTYLNGGNPISYDYMTLWATSTVVNAFQVTTTGVGNINTGTFKLYGVAN